jgi:uncharacterized protein (DUF3820 family)
MINTKQENDTIEKAENFRLPWGKFKGRPLSEVPDSYLRWIAENVKNDRIATYADIVAQYRDRY